MKNYIADGKVVPLTAPDAGVVAGTAYKIGGLVVVAEVTAAAGEPFGALVSGVVTHAKAASQAWAEGVNVYWDNSAKLFTTVSSGNTLAGVAAAAVGAGAEETTGSVRLDGAAR